MELTLEQIRVITHGALAVAQDAEGKFEFRRFTDYQQSLYDGGAEKYAKRSRATAGVRLEFVTDSSNFSFDYRTRDTHNRAFYYFDVLVDGKMVQHFGHDQIKEAVGTVKVKLPEGKHRVAVYFPCLFYTKLFRVRLDDGAAIEPVEKKHRLLCYGDSITQGYDARHASMTYANLIADMLDAELLDQGVGGETFHPELIDPDMAFDPDIITVAYGTNDWNKREHDQTVERANGFCERLRNTYPGARILVITPIWRADHTRVTKVGRFEDIQAIVRHAAERVGLPVVDGLPLVPEEPELFADGYLHPNDDGFQFYVRNLLPHIERLLSE